jgi:hypothetical protein
MSQAMSIPAYMFDTVVFNRILDGVLDISMLRGRARFYATHIQLDEILKTSNLERREALLAVFNKITERKVATESMVSDVSRLDEAKLGGGNIVPTESAVWNVSRWGQAKWGEEDGLCSAFKAELDRLNKNKANNVQDSLIGETTIKYHFTLVTDDSDLFRVTKQFGGECTDTKKLPFDLGA